MASIESVTMIINDQLFPPDLNKYNNRFLLIGAFVPRVGEFIHMGYDRTLADVGFISRDKAMVTRVTWDYRNETVYIEVA